MNGALDHRKPECVFERLAGLDALRLADGALTGPVSRGDAVTVAAHVRALAREDPAVLPSYAAMARRTAERARDAGRLTTGQTEAVLAVLVA